MINLRLYPKIIVFDRDGTLIFDKVYIKDFREVNPIPFMVQVIHKIRNWNVSLGVVSNQSGIGRGLITEAQARRVNEEFVRLFNELGIQFDFVLYCPHIPEAQCDCRKPRIGLLESLFGENLKDFDFFVVGDKESDIQMARNLSAQFVQVEGGQSSDQERLLLGRLESWYHSK